MGKSRKITRILVRGAAALRDANGWLYSELHILRFPSTPSNSISQDNNLAEHVGVGNVMSNGIATGSMVFKKANPLWAILAALPDSAISVANDNFEAQAFKEIA
ncbi:MAG: hypothetical protein M3O03_10560 [Pseudomonadota bacterium]|nr:hypothetical protein [Pseudomonadota bacterium]